MATEMREERLRCVLDHEAYGQCKRPDCRCDCHDNEEYRFPYGWQLRETYGASDGG